MIVVLSSTEPPRLIDLDRLDRLHAELDGDLAAAQLGDHCRVADADHVWLDVAAARAAGVAASNDTTFAEQFDAMIAYATAKGWLDDDGTHVRAHVERADRAAE